MSASRNNLALLTGSTGLLGGHMLVHLIKAGKKVRCLTRATSSLEQLKLICSYYNLSFEELQYSVEWVQGNTLDYIGLCDLMNGVAEVYHCAAIVSFNAKDRLEVLQTNIQGTSNMVDAALKAGVEKFCFISSIASLGTTPDHSPIDEDTPRKNDDRSSAYSDSKFRSELEVWRGISAGLNAVIVNPGVILGPGDPEKGSLFLFQTGRNGMPFYTKATTGYVDVRDVCTISIELMERCVFKKRFILISENVHNGNVFSLIAKEFGNKPPRIIAGKALLKIGVLFSTILGWITGKTPQLTNETIRSAQNPQVYSNERLRKTLGYSFIPLSDTIHEIADFFKKNNL
jgi:dihydroflavonol-4-reductase